ncbi:Cyclic nucleotide-binding domain-containing protein [Heracleum sosnowskyi]|uniref:Cyclic nucleotide-binding domain-containing protein n=1 Tax=Heracleum sosnowskyi TaxID=360622 RepID=A0AAD8HTB9_9APIA|nr:Cyclic nucleotide-binding domain-containing protein [Heracleum sosnowskyi]
MSRCGYFAPPYVVWHLSVHHLILLLHTMTLQRDVVNEMLQFASKNRLPEGLKEKMLTHMQLKYRTAELQQEEVLEDLPKAIRSSITKHLFRKTLEDTYLFKNVSEEFIGQMVSEIKAEYFPPNVEIILQNEMPTDFYIVVSGTLDILKQKNTMEQVCYVRLCNFNIEA